MKFKAHLNEDGQDLGDVPLVGLDVLLEEGVKVEQQQLVDADGAGDDGHHRQPRLQPLVGLLQPREQPFRKCLRHMTVWSQPAAGI